MPIILPKMFAKYCSKCKNVYSVASLHTGSHHRYRSAPLTRSAAGLVEENLLNRGVAHLSEDAARRRADLALLAELAERDRVDGQGDGERGRRVGVHDGRRGSGRGRGGGDDDGGRRRRRSYCHQKRLRNLNRLLTQLARRRGLDDELTPRKMLLHW